MKLITIKCSERNLRKFTINIICKNGINNFYQNLLIERDNFNILYNDVGKGAIIEISMQNIICKT